MNSKMINVMKNTVQMLKIRKYQIPRQILNFEYTHENIEDFATKFASCFVCKNNQKQNVLVHFAKLKFGVNEMRNTIEILNNFKIKYAIVIVANKPTQHCRKPLLEYKDIKMEFFCFHEMIINAVNHELVPRHELLNVKEGEEVTKTWGYKLPGISVNDVISRYYNGKIGNIFKIYRKEGIYYRMVVPHPM